MKKIVNTVEEVQPFIDTLQGETKYIVDVLELENNAGFIINWQEQKFYTGYENGEQYPDEFWMTKDNDMIQIQDLSEDHCKNILRMIIRGNREMAEAMLEFKAKLLSESIQSALSDDDDDDDDIPGGNYIVPPTPHTLH